MASEKELGDLLAGLRLDTSSHADAREFHTQNIIASAAALGVPSTLFRTNRTAWRRKLNKKLTDAPKKKAGAPRKVTVERAKSWSAVVSKKLCDAKGARKARACGLMEIATSLIDADDQKSRLRGTKRKAELKAIAKRVGDAIRRVHAKFSTGEYVFGSSAK